MWWGEQGTRKFDPWYHTASIVSHAFSTFDCLWHSDVSQTLSVLWDPCATLRSISSQHPAPACLLAGCRNPLCALPPRPPPHSQWWKVQGHKDSGSPVPTGTLALSPGLPCATEPKLLPPQWALRDIIPLSVSSPPFLRAGPISPPPYCSSLLAHTDSPVRGTNVLPDVSYSPRCWPGSMTTQLFACACVSLVGAGVGNAVTPSTSSG